MVTAEDFIREVRKLAKEQPTFRYDESVIEFDGVFRDSRGDEILNSGYLCRNVFRDSTGEVIPNTGCIVGQAMQRLGLLDKFNSLDTFPDGADASGLLAKLGVSGTSLEVSWLCFVQQAQDISKTWEDAVRYADKMIGWSDQ